MRSDYTVRRWTNGDAFRFELSLFSTSIVIREIKEVLRGFGRVNGARSIIRLPTEPPIIILLCVLYDASFERIPSDRQTFTTKRKCGKARDVSTLKTGCFPFFVGLVHFFSLHKRFHCRSQVLAAARFNWNVNIFVTFLIFIMDERFSAVYPLVLNSDDSNDLLNWNWNTLLKSRIDWNNLTNERNKLWLWYV